MIENCLSYMISIFCALVLVKNWTGNLADSNFISFLEFETDYT